MSRLPPVAEPDSTPNFTSRLSPRSRKILGGTVAAVLLAATAVVGWNEWTKWQVNAARARCRSAGSPMTLAEIRPPKVEDADNAHPFIVRIGALLKSEAFVGRHQENGIMERLEKFQERHPLYRLAAPAAAELATILATAEVREVLALLRAAGDKPGYNAHLQYERGFALDISDVGTFHKSLRLLGWQVRLAASRGEADAAHAGLWTMMKCADFLADEPTLISQLTRVACIGLALETLQKIGAITPIPREWAARFGARISQLDFTTSFVRAVNAERVVVSSTVFDEMLKGNLSLRQLLADVGSPSGENAASELRFIPNGQIRLWQAEYLNHMHQVKLAFVDRARGEAARYQHLHVIGESTASYHPVVRLIVPSYTLVAEKLWRTRAQISVATAGLALAHYHAETQSYPADLTALVPAFLREVPRDDFDGKPLRYLRRPAGAAVYGVGPNRLDDGGVADAEAEKDDIVWHVGLIPDNPAGTIPR